MYTSHFLGGFVAEFALMICPPPPKVQRCRRERRDNVAACLVNDALLVGRPTPVNWRVYPRTLCVPIELDRQEETIRTGPKLGDAKSGATTSPSPHSVSLWMMEQSFGCLSLSLCVSIRALAL